MSIHISHIVRPENLQPCIAAGLALEPHSLIMIGPANTETLDYRLDFKFLRQEAGETFAKWSQEPPFNFPGPLLEYQWSKFIRKGVASFTLDFVHKRPVSLRSLCYQLLEIAKEMELLNAEQTRAVYHRLEEDSRCELAFIERMTRGNNGQQELQ